MRERSSEKELIDHGLDHYSRDEYEDCLMELDRIGRLLGGDRATLNAFRACAEEPTSILDVGCGGGFLTKRLAEAYPKSEVVGIDINPLAIEFAKNRIGKLPSNLSFEYREKPELNDAPKSFDVVTATLVCHHLTTKELIIFLRQATAVARSRVILNDLHRHWFALASFRMIAPSVFRNRLITHDGLISIKRAFTRRDWEQILFQAGFKPATWSIMWNFAFRWVVTLQCANLPDCFGFPPRAT